MAHEAANPGSVFTGQPLPRNAVHSLGLLGGTLLGAITRERAGAKGHAGKSKSKRSRSRQRATAEKRKGSKLGPTGPTGPTGPAGDSRGVTGRPGPDGIPGPAGRSSGAFLGVTTVQAGVMVAPGDSAVVTATCPTVPADQQIIATGGGINAEAGSFMLATSDRVAQNAWRIIATNTGSGTARLGGYVVCVWFSK